MLENSINRSESLEYKTNSDFCHLFSQLTIIIVLQMEQDCPEEVDGTITFKTAGGFKNGNER
jgi:hypothetical protein